jgi:hypothetical protein
VVLKLIACEVFFREASLFAASSPHLIDAEFTEKGAHDKSETLRNKIQAAIDAARSGTRAYDAVILGYGLCGNGLLGIKARSIPLVIPRAHDCCTVFLGSREAFTRYFKDNPSLPFSSAGYMERGGDPIHEATALSHLPGVAGSLEELIERYGEENGRYIFDSLASPPVNKDHAVMFIDVPELSRLGFAQKCRARAQEAGMEFRLVPGDSRLIRMLLHGEWNEEEFLTVPPGHKIGGVYDWDKIVRADP